jgi:aminoglycoside phosphotransferase (APT) family kinase protein
MRQPADDRALYYRELRRTVRAVFAPELTSAHAIDAAALVDRILCEFIVEEEAADTLSAEFGAELAALLSEDGAGAVSVARFDALRREAAASVARGAGTGDRLSNDLVDVERRFFSRLDELRRAVFAEAVAIDEAEAPSACSVTSEQLTGYLRDRLAHSPGVVVDGVTALPGGRSKETILVSLSGTAELPPEVVLRKDRPVGVLETKASDEYAVLDAVHRFGGVPVPEPFFAEDAGNALGDGTFLVMSRVPGHKAGEYFPDLAAPTEHRAEIGAQLAASLGRLHSLPPASLSGTRLAARPTDVTKESLTAAIEGMATRIDALTGAPCAAVYLARDWLLEHVADVVPTTGACLLQGDVGLHNTLVEGARITALVDWEGATIGPPARELALAWRAATALLPWPAFVDAYLGAGGPREATDPRAIGFYRVFGALGGFMMSKTGGHLFRTGAKRDLNTAHSGLDSQLRCARDLGRALADAMSVAG